MRSARRLGAQVLRAIERRQMLFIRVFTMVFLAGLFFGTRYNSPRYLAKVEVLATDAPLQMSVLPRSDIDANHIGSRSPDRADTTATMLNSPEFARRVSMLLHRIVRTSAYNAHAHKAGGIVEISSESSSASLAAETVEGVAAALISLQSEALARSKVALARTSGLSRVRARCLPSGHPCSALAGRERDACEAVVAAFEVRQRPGYFYAMLPQAGVQPVPPGARALMFAGVLAVALAVLAVVVDNLTARRRQGEH